MALASDVGKPFVLLYNTAEKPSLCPVGSTEIDRFKVPDAFRDDTLLSQKPAAVSISRHAIAKNNTKRRFNVLLLNDRIENIKKTGNVVKIV